MIIYGDYMDLNCVGDYDTSGPDHISLEEKEELRPVWEMFIGGNLNLVKGRIKYEEYLELPKIFVHHYVFETNQYTTYSIVKGKSRAGDMYVQHCKSFENRFIDREQGVLLLEKTDIRGKVPASLEEIKEKEIAFHKAALKRFTSGDVPGAELSDADRKELVHSWEVCRQHEQEEIDRWENKTTMRWFY